MAVRTIAYAADEALLITFEGTSLLAFDALDGTPKWRLELPRAIVGVTFGSPNAIAAVGAANPWRSGLSGRTAFAVDATGVVHVIGAAAGTLHASTEKVGAPVATAAGLDAFAVATAETVVVWRDGARSELAHRATALAFSADGKSLGVGTKKGDFFVVDLTTNAVTSHGSIGESITDLASSEPTGWLVGTSRSLCSVGGQSWKTHVDGPVRAIAVDPRGLRVAVVRAEQCALVYPWPMSRWPEPTALTRITLKGRFVSDVAFGPNDRVGVALNRGDGAIVDGAGLSAAKLQPHLGRPAAHWQVLVQDEMARARDADRAAAREAKSPSRKLGLSAVGALALVGRMLFVLMHASSSKSTYTPPPDFLKTAQCDADCESTRIHELELACTSAPVMDCANDAATAEQARRAGDCGTARASLDQIQAKLGRLPLESSGLIRAYLAPARTGLATGCHDSDLPPSGVVRLAGTDFSPMQEPIPLHGATPSQVYAAPSGDVFVTAVDANHRGCDLWHRSRTGAWIEEQSRDTCTDTSLFGRAGDDVFVGLGNRVVHYDGRGWSNLDFAGTAALGITGAPDAGADVFVSDHQGVLMRWTNGDWRTEKLPEPNLVLGPMAYAGSTLVVGAIEGRGGKTLLLLRNAAGTWSIQRKTAGLDPLYATADGQLLAARGDAVLTSTDGATWSQPSTTPVRPVAFWARSRDEVFAGGAKGLAVFDGRVWSPTGFRDAVTAISGTDAELYVLSPTSR